MKTKLFLLITSLILNISCSQANTHKINKDDSELEHYSFVNAHSQEDTMFYCSVLSDFMTNSSFLVLKVEETKSDDPSQKYVVENSSLFWLLNKYRSMSDSDYVAFMLDILLNDKHLQLTKAEKEELNLNVIDSCMDIGYEEIIESYVDSNGVILDSDVSVTCIIEKLFLERHLVSRDDFSGEYSIDYINTPSKTNWPWRAEFLYCCGGNDMK